MTNAPFDLTTWPPVVQALVNAVPDGLLVVAPDGTMLLANAQMERLFGYRREELLGQPVELLVPDRLRETHHLIREHYTREPRSRPMGAGPYLGQKEKFIVLLTDTRSALGRYLRTYVGVENEYSYRAKYPDCYFLGATYESLKDNGRDLDIALHTSVAGAVAQNFVDAFRNTNQSVPEWMRYGIAHWYGRRIEVVCQALVQLPDYRCALAR